MGKFVVLKISIFGLLVAGIITAECHIQKSVIHASPISQNVSDAESQSLVLHEEDEAWICGYLEGLGSVDIWQWYQELDETLKVELWKKKLQHLLRQKELPPGQREKIEYLEAIFHTPAMQESKYRNYLLDKWVEEAHQVFTLEEMEILTLPEPRFLPQDMESTSRIQEIKENEKDHGGIEYMSEKNISL